MEVSGPGGRRAAPGSIFDALEAESGRFRQADVPGMEGFLGGFVGYIGYPAVGRLERLELHDPAVGEEDEAVFGLFGSLLRFDHRRQIVLLVHNVLLDGERTVDEAYNEGRKALDAMELKFLRSVSSSQSFTCDMSAPVESTDEEGYCAAVTKAKHYITEGDIFQVVLSRRVSFPFSGDLFAVYRALRMINPSPYAARRFLPRSPRQGRRRDGRGAPDRRDEAPGRDGGGRRKDGGRTPR